MISTPSKLVREHFARAKGQLSKDEVLKSVSSALQGLEQLVRGRVVGAERFNVDVHINEYFTEFNRHPGIKKYFNAKGIQALPFVKYARGLEKKVRSQLSEMERDLQTKEKRGEEVQEEKKEQRKADMLHKGQQLLDEGDHPRGKGIMRRVAEAYGDEPGVIVDIGERFLKAKLLMEAAGMLEKAVEKFPSDPKGWSLLVKAYTEMREFERLEKVFKAALKQFGMHPKTLSKMARMYYEWRKYDEAYDTAKQAYDQDNSLTEAKKIMAATEKRIFGEDGKKKGGGMSFNI